MKPKREKREWVKHSVHCRCDVALEEALAALAALIDRADCRYDHHGHCQEHGHLADGPCAQWVAKQLLAKFGSFQKKGGRPDAGAARNGPAASAEISEQQETARMQALSRGGWEG